MLCCARPTDWLYLACRTRQAQLGLRVIGRRMTAHLSCPTLQAMGLHSPEAMPCHNVSWCMMVYPGPGLVSAVLCPPVEAKAVGPGLWVGSLAAAYGPRMGTPYSYDNFSWSGHGSSLSLNLPGALHVQRCLGVPVYPPVLLWCWSGHDSLDSLAFAYLSHFMFASCAAFPMSGPDPDWQQKTRSPPPAINAFPMSGPDPDWQQKTRFTTASH
ncbi:hypothetical protein HaLaN_07982 [Haematococcus lacustris]|uniref:Uncharacterized protein n=1 Tax=Haematococcus lacustris TaxID=44745 RepID=A0A699YQB1_HAELA|nr:hypothetical protein HaLaN_07982 [Haematococcus lacustris]